jgi:UDP-N-acetylmuramate--alanine ligase
MDMQGDWPLPPTLVLNADSAGCLELLGRLRGWQGQVVTYSVAGSPLLRQPAIFEAVDVKLDAETGFRVRAHGATTFPEEQIIHLQLPGVYNVENALAALIVARLVGVEVDTIVGSLAEFGGTRRRFEIRHQGPLQIAGRVRDVVLVDDYAHHPTAIAATLEATRRRYPNRRIVAVYQPHMYSRTKTFFEQFLQSFDDADVVIIADIFPARERDTGLVHTKDLVVALGQRVRFASAEAQVFYGGDVTAATHLLEEILQSGDFVVIMGAGDIYNVTEQLLRSGSVDLERNV